MRTQDKLTLIKQLSQMSQEQLAAELGVSFPTLNSWINGRSVPRQKACARIDAAYLRFTGQNVIPASALEAKKQILHAKRARYPGVLKRLAENRDIYDDFVLALTYNTNRIEGSTLTEPETAAILFQNASLPNKTILEQMEVKNHQAALGVLFRSLAEKTPINDAFILKLHGILLNGIQEDAGQYRKHGVRMAGSHVPTANYLKVPFLMKQLNEAIAEKVKDILGHGALIHSRFEQIHPFSDGNGRVGRLLLAAMLLREDFPPVIIRQEKRRFYIQYLNKSQMENDSSLLEDLLCDGMMEAYGILGRKNGERGKRQGKRE